MRFTILTAMRGARVVALSWTMLALSTRAFADDAPVAAQPDEAFAQGQALQDKHKFGAALAAFRRSYAAKPTPMNALHIGECEAGLGHYDVAEADFRALAGSTIPEGSPPEFTEARDHAKEELAKLGHMPTVRVTLSSPELDVAITLDDVPIQLSAPRKVAAGKHMVRVSSSHREPVVTTVLASDDEHVQVSVVLPAPVADVAAPASPVEREASNPALVGGGIALTVIGGVALTAGTFLFLATNDSFSSRDDPARTASIVSLVGGTLALIGGIPMIAIGSRPVKVPASSFVPPSLAPARTVTLTWAF